MRWSLSNGPDQCMPGRLLYSALLIGSVAMLLFVAGFVCLQLGLGLLTSLFYVVAGKIMLLAFGLLLLLGAGAVVVAVWRELSAYFNREMSAMRRVLAVQVQQRQLSQLAVMEGRQIRYLNRFKRQRLLAANNRKHLRALFDAIHQELQAVRTQLPAATYESLLKTLRNHHKHADAEAMLALRKQIPCR